MGAPKLIKKDFENNAAEQNSFSTIEKVNRTYTDELIIGICAPIGADKLPVIHELSERLKEEYGYDVEIIKLSKFIDDLHGVEVDDIPGKTTAFAELMHRINGGNQIRANSKSKSILAEFAVANINRDRNIKFGGSNDSVSDTEEMKSRRKCFIVDSLKNKDEIELLRKIYRDMFYLFSVYSPSPERKTVLTKKDLSPSEVRELVKSDEHEDNDFGQDVRNTFVEADFFVRASEANLDKVKINIGRYLSLIFEAEVITPLPHENAMYQATSAAGNSACLSRQVGACITDENTNLISVGWNDVPKFGGGLYEEGFVRDDRCFAVRGLCSNDKHKIEISNNILESIMKIEEIAALDVDVLRKKLKKVITTSNLKNLIEFSRSVHAEMHAIITGSQMSGSKMIKGKLFCTTYPCHNCARHIVSAGISEVYYIEPYKKSLCLELHDDSMTEDEGITEKVRILVYDGVAPRRYLSFFSKKTDRKKADGSLIILDKTMISPRNRVPLQALTILENQAIQNLPSSPTNEGN